MSQLELHFKVSDHNSVHIGIFSVNYVEKEILFASLYGSIATCVNYRFCRWISIAVSAYVFIGEKNIYETKINLGNIDTIDDKCILSKKRLSTYCIALYKKEDNLQTCYFLKLIGVQFWFKLSHSIVSGLWGFWFWAVFFFIVINISVKHMVVLV